MNHISHALFLILKSCQNKKSGDAQPRYISLAARHLSHQSKKVRHRFQPSNHRVIQFSGFTSSMFLFQQGRRHQSYQLNYRKVITETWITLTFKMFVQMLLHTLFSSIETSTFRHVVVLCTAKLVYSLTSVLFPTRIASHQINQTFIITVKTMVCLKGFLSDGASKSISFCYIFTHFAMFTNTFVTRNCFVAGTSSMKSQVYV